MGHFVSKLGKLFIFGLFAALCHFSPQPAFAQQPPKEKRIALVIGNSGYQHVPKLLNPLNDANAIADKFKSSGFDVDIRHDLSNTEMRRAMREFTVSSRSADIAVVYFAGHGFEVSGTNYLIPVDAKLQSDFDVEDEAFSLDRVVKTLEPAKRLRLIILDACRDNPFLKTMTRTVASRQISSGLAKVEPDTTLIAFAAKAGSTADDGAGKHSPFTVALLNNLFEPGTDIRIALGRVRDEVKRATGNKQEPFVYGSLGGSTISLVPAPEAKPAAAAPAADPHANIRRDYELAAQIGTRRAWDSFLDLYKTGFFAELAKEARSKIIAAENAEASAAEQKAKADAAEKARAANAAAERAKADAAKLAAEAAERARAEAAEKARSEAARQQEEARKAEEARRALEARKAEEAGKAEEARRALEAEADRRKVAALPAEANEPEVTRSLQTELRRVGCHLGAVDGRWNPASQRALESFNRHAGMKLEVAAASADALDAVKAKTSRICPLICERGFRAQGERCVAIACGRDETLDDGVCRKRPSKAAAKPDPKKPSPDREKNAGSGGRGGQDSVVCDPRGCRSGKIGRANPDGSLPAGCQRVNTAGNTAFAGSVHAQQIICN